MTVTLVTGPVRSGKSRHAEDLLSGARQVLYVATGPRPDPVGAADAERADAEWADAEWAARVAAHRSDRPSDWTTVESLEVAATIRSARRPVLVDCLGTWITGLADQAGWHDLDAARTAIGAAREDLLGALADVPVPVVLVTNEVGWGVVPSTPSGRFFQDELGRVNAAVSAVADTVHLVVAGRVLDLTAAPVVPRRPRPRTLRA